ncbi:MAG TPA: response regulator transcription factor [Terriglobia bacterium]|nr:response regulator transcription factor [Terriglobia bacterium]
MPIRILLADDHQMVRQGLKALLEQEGFKVIGEAADGHQATRRAQELLPDIAILDLAMPLMNGIGAAKAISQISPQTKVVVLTMHTEAQYVLEALRAGIRGYVLKSRAAGELVQAIREVSRGSTFLSSDISDTVVDAYLNKVDVPSDTLSPRELQVLQLVAEGKTTKEVASLLNISVKTAESHRTRIMEKLDIHETASLVRYAIRRGLVQP